MTAKRDAAYLRDLADIVEQSPRFPFEEYETRTVSVNSETPRRLREIAATLTAEAREVTAWDRAGGAVRPEEPPE